MLSDRLSRFVVAGFLSLFIAAHFQSLPLWFRLLSRWRKEAVRLLSKPRNTQARHQCQNQKAKEFSRWLQCDIKKEKTPLLQAQEKTRSSVQGEENPGQASGHRLHIPGSTRNPEVTESGTSDVEGKFLDARKRTADCIVVIWTQRVPKSQCTNIGRPIAVYVERK